MLYLSEETVQIFKGKQYTFDTDRQKSVENVIKNVIKNEDCNNIEKCPVQNVYGTAYERKIQ